MTPKQQQIKIAEACGWTHVEKEEGGAIYGCPKTKPMFDSCRLFAIPNYLNDLNAMHEAEKACLTTIPLVTDYGIRLVNALHREHKKNPRIQDTSWRIPVVGNCGWFATAAQRAEAFLKTLNLWEE